MNLLKRITPFLSAIVITLLLFSCSDTAMDSGNGKNGGEQPEPYSHTRNPGESANDFLADSNFTELTVEIDYMEGYEPNSDAVSSLETFLEQRLNKTSVTILDPTQISSGGQDTYSAGEVRNLEEQHRDNFTENEGSETLYAYMIILDGKYSQDNVLGIAYYNTSSAFFGAAYDEVSGGIGQPSRYQTEATSFRHEFGHLFGLVAIPGSGTEMQTPHKDPDPDHGNHCDNDSCLMYYAMESTDLFSGAFGSNIPPLDQNCRDDLAANGGK